MEVVWKSRTFCATMKRTTSLDSPLSHHHSSRWWDVDQGYDNARQILGHSNLFMQITLREDGGTGDGVWESSTLCFTMKMLTILDGPPKSPPLLQAVGR